MDMHTEPLDPGTEALDDFLGVRPPSLRSRILKWGAIALGVLLLVWMVWRVVVGGGSEAPLFATEQVRRADLRVSVTATGNLTPTNEVEVGSELSGTITDVFVDNNDRVTRGQVIARLDVARLQDAINQSEAALKSAEAAVRQAEATVSQQNANLRRLEEVRRLSGGRVPAPAELDAARAEQARAVAGAAEARALVEQARAQLSSDRTQLSKAIIRSPVMGVVLSRQVEPGQTVAASFNAPVLFTIAEDLAQMQLEVKVDEADVAQVDAGQRATFQVDAFPGRTFPATVTRVDLGANAGTSGSSTSSSSSSTSSSGTAGTVVAYTAVLTVANPELLLRPGMTATAEIVSAERQNVLLVPNAALRFSPGAEAGSEGPGITNVLLPPRRRRAGRAQDVTIGRGSRQTIYVLDGEQPQPVEVTVGDSNGSLTEVRGPNIREGMRVITGQLASGTDR